MILEKDNELKFDKEDNKEDNKKYNKLMYVLMDGNLSEGFVVYGPFSSYDEAMKFDNNNNGTGWIMEMRNPQ